MQGRKAALTATQSRCELSNLLILLHGAVRVPQHTDKHEDVATLKLPPNMCYMSISWVLVAHPLLAAAVCKCKRLQNTRGACILSAVKACHARAWAR
jgi:hypothetical protein